MNAEGAIPSETTLPVDCPHGAYGSYTINFEASGPWYTRTGWILIGIAVIMTSGAIIAYIISACMGTVPLFLPYISEAGGRLPQSGIFGMGLILSSILGSDPCGLPDGAMNYVIGASFAVYIRYDIVKKVNDGSNKMTDRANFHSLYFGLIGTFSLIGIALYPESLMLSVHLTFACLFFGFAVVYMVMQTYITYNMYLSNYDSRSLLFLRTATVLVKIICDVIIIVFAPIILVFPGWKISGSLVMNDGDASKIVSAAGEWISAGAIIVFFASYYRDFQKTQVYFRLRSSDEHFHEKVLPQTLNRSCLTVATSVPSLN